MIYSSSRVITQTDRIDRLLVETEYAPSIAEAQRLIKAKAVRWALMDGPPEAWTERFEWHRVESLKDELPICGWFLLCCGKGYRFIYTLVDRPDLRVDHGVRTLTVRELIETELVEGKERPLP